MHYKTPEFISTDTDGHSEAVLHTIGQRKLLLDIQSDHHWSFEGGYLSISNSLNETCSELPT